MAIDKNDPVAIAVFAKAPMPGFAKTRLIPRLGTTGAAELQGWLVERAIATAVAAGVGPVSLWCAPDEDHAVFRRLAREHPIALYPQNDADLGARMLAAFDTLTPAAPVILIGTDCPALTADQLGGCAAALRSGQDAVFVPAEDGGYVLVGLRRPQPALFEDIAWSTPDVMAQTRQRAISLGLRWSEPITLWDVDLPADLDRLAASGLAPEALRTEAAAGSTPPQDHLSPR